MTALEKYTRLEAIGAWCESPGADPREVVVSFGDATLVLTDMRDMPLAHWALAGTQVIGATPGGTVYATDAEGFETLTIRDRDMVEAIAAVSRAHLLHPLPGAPRRRQRHPPVAALFGIAAVLAAAAFGPNLVFAQAVRMVPREQAEEFGDRMLLALMAQGGPLCQDPAGRRALTLLAERLAVAPSRQLRVLDLGDTVAAAPLPGGAILLDRATLIGANSPEEAAGWIALALARDAREPALAQMMRAAGIVPSLGYIFTGKLGEAALSRGSDAALAPPKSEDTAAAFDLLRAAGVPAAPLAGALQRAGLTVDDPLPSAAAAPVLADQDWVALQGICG